MISTTVASALAFIDRQNLGSLQFDAIAQQYHAPISNLYFVNTSFKAEIDGAKK
ncbi:MAG: hypothetical protein V7L02_28915 [Nostoc sp.]|uniref:hypothetical protein n=1 Tax=Nostoc sp. TaxID=1180 RepID=UPI002FF9A022